MKRILLLIALFPIAIWANWDQVFFNNEDPAMFHHVNVISGNLNLSLQDFVVRGAVPISITRTYSSSGALERGQKDSVEIFYNGFWNSVRCCVSMY
jgi:hypothetical protein